MKDDKELVKEVLSGRIAAFEEIMRRYEMSIVHFCFDMVRNKESAEDITQEVFVTVYNKLFTFNSDYKFSTWLYQIAKNRCIDHMRRNRKFQHLELMEAEDMTSGVRPDQEVEFKETKMAVREFLNTLSKTDRLILFFRYTRESLTFSDIAQIMKMSESNVKKRYYRTYEKYEDFLEAYKGGISALCKE